MQVVQTSFSRSGVLAVSALLVLTAQLHIPAASCQAVRQESHLKSVQPSAQRLQMCSILQ